jgi:DUF4097 and DUF4098 domain-containing protein YvlB
LKGKIKANTSGGGISGSNIEGELSTNTSGGSIKLTDLSCSLETSTHGGHIDVTIKKLGEYIRINNSGGNIDLQMPGDKGVDLKLHGRINKVNLKNFSGTKDDDRITGKLNGGGIPVSIDASSGRINLILQ